MNREKLKNKSLTSAAGIVLAVSFGLATIPTDANAKPKPTRKAAVISKKKQSARHIVQLAEPATCYAEYVGDAKTGEPLAGQNFDKPVLPASTVKPILGLLIDDAVHAGQMAWDDTVQVALPRPDHKKVRIHDTICDTSTLGQYGHTDMTVRTAFDNTVATSNLQTTVALAGYLEQRTGRTYRDLATAKLIQIGADATTVVEPVGLSNAAACLNEHRKEGRYAEALASMTPEQRAATHQNITTARDMGRWALAVARVSGLAQAFKQKTVEFAGHIIHSTNPFHRTADISKKGKQLASPTGYDWDDQTKTGYTETAGNAITTVLNPYHERPIVITLAACPAGPLRSARLFQLTQKFKHLTGARIAPVSMQPNLDIYAQIADSRSGGVPLTAPAPTGE